MLRFQKAVLSGATLIAVLGALAAQPEISAPSLPPPSVKKHEPLVPAWTTDARWYYINVPRFCNGDKDNDPENVLPWNSSWPPLETPETAPYMKTGEWLPPHARRYGGDLRGVVQRLPYLKELGINAILLSPVFHGVGEIKLDQVDLRHVDDAVGVKGSLAQANSEGSLPDKWIWTSSDKTLREVIQTAHELGMRVVISGIFHAVMAPNSLPSEMESYYLSSTRRWMDPDGDGNPQDGVDGWMLSVEERGLRSFDDKYKAFWSRWREMVAKINPQAVVISSGTLALGELAEGPYDIALHSAYAGALSDVFGIRKDRKAEAGPLFEALESAKGIAPASTASGNIALVSGGYYSPRLPTAVAATEPLQKGRKHFEGPVPDGAARMRWKLAVIAQHLLPGAPVTWYGDEVGMFGGPGNYADAPMWWKDDAGATPEHYRPDLYALIKWLHHLRESYPTLRHGSFRQVLSDDQNKVMAFSRQMPGEEIVAVFNYGDTKQLVMLPAGKPMQLAGVRCPTLKSGEPPKGAESNPKPKPEFPHQPVIAARQFVNDEGLIRMWLDPMSVRLVFLEDSPKQPNNSD